MHMFRLGLLLTLGFPAAAAALQLVSATPGRQPAPADADSFVSRSGGSAVSASGQWLVFASEAGNLVPLAQAGGLGIYMHDRLLGRHQRIDVSPAGNPGSGPSEHPAISADGNMLVFHSFADNLVSGDLNQRSDIWLRDRSTDRGLQQISVDSSGRAGNGHSFAPAVSARGEFVVFNSQADNLLAPMADSNASSDVFIRDRQRQRTVLASRSSNGQQGNRGSSEATISADGRWVAFSSLADNLVAGDSNGVRDVFLHDRELQLTTRISMRNDGGQADRPSSGPVLAADGESVVLVSAADLGAGCATSAAVYVFDRRSARHTLISPWFCASAQYCDADSPAISADGRRIAFVSDAHPRGGCSGTPQVWLHDRDTGRTMLVSRDQRGQPGAEPSLNPQLSGDGASVLFQSRSTNWWLPTLTHGLSNVYLVQVSGK